ncbi:VOC family protein [Nocardiopsis mangrovi]|uniref:VOC family protein n=1 Tax=Nocardiopsis mangrovi TaxID=1179818 RepID=A0ABV9DQA7_9ACTN
MRLVYVLDTNDLRLAGEFWTAALGFEPVDVPNRPYLELKDPNGRWPDLLLQEVPEPKTGKNRMHLDMVVPDLHAEVPRLLALGAVHREGPVEEAHHRVVVLADPEGNEFCVIDHLTGGGTAR